MEKYGVKQGLPIGKTAGEQDTCPSCGEKTKKTGTNLWCPNCGTEPFEDDDKEKDDEDRSSWI